MLLLQGTLDMITPIDHALWMERALREAGNQQVQLELIDRMGHFTLLKTIFAAPVCCRHPPYFVHSR